MATKTRNKMARLGPIEAYAPTVREARAYLKDRVAEALEGSYQPAILNHGGRQAVVYRTPTGWEYQLSDQDRPLAPAGVRDVSGVSLLGNVTRAEAIQSAAAHLVGLDGVDYHTHNDFPAWFTDRTKQSNVLATRRFNRAYRYAKTMVPDCENDNAWHNWAGNHMFEERFA